uniref:Uncharacterized protein n=1 Tax=Anguilla anguilla TaxID=7936 RepID=A0A0E9S759_ANGAN
MLHQCWIKGNCDCHKYTSAGEIYPKIFPVKHNDKNKNNRALKC